VTGETDVEDAPQLRTLRLTAASKITPEPVIWAWEPPEGGRIPAGALTLAAGREGTGKSSFGIWLAAQLSQGTLHGSFKGRPRAVFYAAVEDSWSRTLVPRLMAAGADLERVYRVDVETIGGSETTLSLPRDVDLIEQAIAEHGAAALIVDPLMSTLHASTDAHRTQDVRRALEPLALMAERSKVMTLGIAHFSKASGNDAAQLISGSGAFKDLARAVLAFARDRVDESKVMTQVKNSLGSLDLPSLAYRIDSADVPTPTGPANVGRLVWDGHADRSVEDTLTGTDDDASDRNEVDQWLKELLENEGSGGMKANEVYQAADACGFSKDQAKRAKKRLGIKADKNGTGPWLWKLPETPQ
jgi:KaiC/GvpD/RAD55 family RecA-like ATPase